MTCRPLAPAAAALAVAAALLAPAPADACAARRDPVPHVYADTLAVSLTTDRAAYRPGARLRLTAAVTRSVQGQALLPAGALVEVRVTTPKGRVLRRFVQQAGDDGRATFGWAVPREASPGAVHADALALREVGPRFDCHTLLYERGTGAAAPLARITR